MNHVTRILIVEDQPSDYELAQLEISRSLKDCVFKRVETRNDFLNALKGFNPDLILSDYSMPKFDGMSALKLAQEQAPLTPLIIWTGSISEETAVNCMSAGAVNYILKENIKRLAPAVSQALRERQLLVERRQAEAVIHDLSRFTEENPNPILRVSCEGKILYANAASKLLLEDWNAASDDLPSSWKDQVAAAYEKNSREWMEISLNDRDYSFLIIPRREACYINLYGNDVTQVKRSEAALRASEQQWLLQSERRFRALIENGSDNISLLAQDGTLLWENPAVNRTLGYKQDEFVNHNIFELIHPDDSAWTSQLFQELLQKAGEQRHGFFRLKHRDGSWRWTEATATNMLQEPSVQAVVVNYRDITERKNAEDELRESQNKYRNLVETTHDLIWSVDSNGIITFLNSAARDIYGYEPEELIGHSFFELMDPQSSHTGPQMFREMISKANEYHGVEGHVRHRDGRLIILSANVIVLRDVDGNAIGAMGSSRDITEQKRAQDQLRASEENYRLLFDSNPLPMWIFDRNTLQFLKVNDAAVRHYGYSIEEFLSMTIKDIRPAEDVARLLKDMANSDRGREQIDRTGIWRHLKKDGTLIFVDVLSHPVDFDGKKAELVLANDVTESKQIEEMIQSERNLLRTLIDNIPDRIYVMDRAGRKTISNVADWHASGGQTMEDVIGKTDFELYPAELAESFWQLDNFVMETGKPVINYEEPGLDSHGDPVSILTTKIPLRDEAGLVTGLVGIGRDITERKQAEHAVQESQKRLNLALAGAQMGVWEWNLQTNGIYWSPECFEVTGIQQESFKGNVETFTGSLHPQDIKYVISSIENAIANKTLFTAEFRIVRPDGEVRWLSDLGQVEYDAAGQPLRLIGTMHDITPRKRAELERQTLLEIMQGLAQTKDLQEFLKLIHQAIAKVIYAENFFVVFHDQETGLFEEIYSVDQYDPPAPPSSLEKSITSYVFRSGKPLLLTSSRFHELVEQGEIQLVGTNSASWLGVPLTTANGTIGVIAVQDYHDENRYSNREVDFLASIASQVALAIERRRAEAAEREQRTLAEALRDTSQILSSSLDYGEVLDHILSAVERVVPHDAATIMIIKGNSAQVVRSHGYEMRASMEDVMGINLPLDETTNLQRMLETKQPEIVYDTHSYPGWKLMQSTDWLRSTVGAPILIYGEVIGFILLDSATIGFFTPVHAERLEAFANQAALAIHNAQLLQQAQNEIVERKRVEEALRSSNERFRQLAENIKEVFWLTDAISGKELYISPAAQSIWGFSSEEILDNPDIYYQSIFPEDRALVFENLEKQRSGERTDIEYRITRPDGSIRWIWDRAFPIFDENGGVKTLAGIAADTTERKQAEMTLKQTQARYYDLFDSSPISLWEEDYSLVKERIESLRQEGITDINEYLLANPQVVLELGSLVKILDVNRASMQLYHAENKEDLLHNLLFISNEEGMLHFRKEVAGLISPEARFTWEGKDATLEGQELAVIVNGSIAPGYEDTWGKVIVSINDITHRKQSEEESQRRAQETAALLATSQTLTNLDLKANLQSIGSSAQNLFAADGCRIFLMQPDGETLRCVLALQENSEALYDLKLKLNEGVTGAVAASGQAEIVNYMQNDPRSMQIPGTMEEEEAIMFAPLKERDRTIGVLSIRRAGTERPFQQSDLELLEAFASMAASAVSNAHLYEEAQRRLAELEALYENGLAVGQLLEPREIGERVIQTFARYLSWHHVTIRLLQPETDQLDLIAFNLPGLNEEQKLEAERQFKTMVNNVGQGLSGWVVQTGTMLRTGNVNALPQYINTQSGIESGLYMPLKIGERVIGVISVESEIPDAFTEQDERLLATLANQAAVAFENARLYQASHEELLERTRAQAALWASESHYHQLADSITDILFELDYNLNFTHWNKASEMLTGIPTDDAIGRSMMEVFGDFEEQSRLEAIYNSILKERQARTFETEIVIKGKKRALEMNAYPSARGVSVVAKDVTERKLDEALLKKRFELMEYSAHHSLQELMQKTLDEVSELTDSHMGFMHLVEEDQQTVRLQAWSTETIEKMGWGNEQGTQDSLLSAGMWADTLRQKRSVVHNNYGTVADQNGTPLHHLQVEREMVIPLVRDDRIVAVLGIGNKHQEYTQHDIELAERFADYAWDITERKRMESILADERNQLARRVEERTADLSRANSNLARALRVKDEFLANMSHELRTPLNAILGLSESLGEQVAGPLNEKQQKYLGTINESGHHLLSLINDILDLAKIEAGQITLDINKVDVNAVCQASLRMIKQLAQKKHQEVEFEIDAGFGLMWADERRLKQMIVNLLSNAVKFTPDSGKLGLEVHGDEAGNRVIITVWDQGIGIREHDLGRLFKPFVQLDSGLAKEAAGTGLGLALVAQMARLHGGSVSVESRPGEGSRFSILLPWEPAIAADASIRLRNTGKFRAIDPNATNKPTILIIEDTREVVMMLADYLEMSGFKIVTAQDGNEGLAQAKLSHPDLILMDIMMPGMDGFETTRKLRMDSEFKDTPIIAMTALAMPSDRQRCLDAGMDEYMSKPVNLRALVKLIRSILLEKEVAKPK